MSGLSGLALVTALAACAAGGGGETDGSTTVPRIERLEPDSGRVGEAYPITARIVGGPFDAEGNVVRFDGRPVGTFESEDGETLEFPVPKTRPSTGEVPPMVLPAGRYEVTVETSAGVSEPAVFVLEVGG